MPPLIIYAILAIIAVVGMTVTYFCGRDDGRRGERVKGLQQAEEDDDAPQA